MFNSLNDILCWCDLCIPTIFDDSLSYLQMLGKLKNVVNECVNAIEKLSKDNITTNGNIEMLKDKVRFLEIKIEGIEKGYNIPDNSITLQKLASDVLNQIQEYVEESVYNCAKFVSFGLDEDGYFVAYIPHNWKDIEFDTSDNGELILKL